MFGRKSRYRPALCASVMLSFMRLIGVWNLQLRLCAQALAMLFVTGVLSPPAYAANVELGRDYDLVTDFGLVHYAQTDGRWASYPVGPNRDKSIGECGCLLAVLATVLNNSVGGMTPWFPTRLLYETSAFDFNPRYLDLFFLGGPTLEWKNGWGYKTFTNGTCGIIPLSMAMQAVGNFGGQPVGVDMVTVRKFGQNAKNIVNRNLIAGRPTIVAVRTKGAAQANHALIIAGWDNTEKTYKYLDPMWPRATINGARLPQVKMGTLDSDPPDAEPSYSKFEKRIEGIIDVRPGVTTIRSGFLFGDDPSPIEILMTGPDGRRTGFDPQTGASFEENDSANYWTFGPWIDPLAEVASGVAPRFVVLPNAASGTYHFTVTGVADGPLQLTAETLFGGRRTLLGEYGGTISNGEVRKYELQFSATGASSVAQVANFTPHAYAGQDLQGRTDTAITFDGRRSFDADGAIAFAWDFGDGGSGTGAQPQHAYTVPGNYTVTLTVTDANGVIATDSLQANIILSQRQPVADVSGPYLGFQSDGQWWSVNLYAAGSSDPNGDPLTYRWDFGDGSPPATTTSPYMGHTYTSLGRYTLTLVVNDGLDDSLPATTQVEIVAAPSNPPTWYGAAFLTPSCGLPGDRVTISMGSYTHIGQSWNFGLNGNLPPFPPRHLMLGLSAPEGQMRLYLLGVVGVYAPFEATLISPGRFVANASFTVPDVAPGIYFVGWADESKPVPFQVPCPSPANHPPIADAGGPYAGEVGLPIRFDGSASSDRDGDALTYAWDFGDGAMAEGINPTHSFANEGRYLVTLTVSDGQAYSTATAGSRSFASTTIAAVQLDSIAPTTTAQSAPPANGNGWNNTEVTVDLHAKDNPGGSGVKSIAYTVTGAQSGADTVAGDTAQIVITKEGVTELTYFATDNAGNVEAPQHLVLRIDRTGPTIVGMPAAGCTLWPPNHKLVTVAQISASDHASGMAPGEVVVTVTSSEPENGLGDGDTAPDYVINDGSVALRAERSGTGVGRTYSITATAIDRAGSVASRQAVCFVPHDQRSGR